MKNTKVVHLGSSKLFSLIRENLIVVIFTLIFSFGILFGCLIFKGERLQLLADSLTDFLILSKSDSSFFRLFLSSFLVSFVFLFSIYLFGTSLLGCAFIPLILFLRGMLSGLLLCDLYTYGAVNALVVNLLTVIPGTVISALALLSAAVKCTNLSYLLGKLSIGDGQALSKIDIKRFICGFALLVFIIAVAAMFEAFMSIAFKNFFNFG
ncbi:MAG: stage II sporulation protein M [Clostridia bacterium]|nr:stage II sporulation protein M [Clostridia bacterium]